jgi:NOL1/NOP2/fmu family ribosome biogenesis protein
MEMIGEWVKVGVKKFIKYKNTVYAWPENLVKDFSILLEQLHVIYSGVLTGELMRNKMVPDHALAMSTIMADAIQRTEVDFENVIKYLQRKELNVEIDHKGWQLITYQTHPLGWINSLSNRINNYYPKELRILKDNFEA